MNTGGSGQTKTQKKLEKISLEREKQLRLENAKESTKLFSDQIAFRKKLRGVFSLLSGGFAGFPGLGVSGTNGGAAGGGGGGGGGGMGGGASGAGIGGQRGAGDQGGGAGGNVNGGGRPRTNRVSNR